jgi:hypothetical protein
MKRIILFILTPWLMMLASHAQNYSIDWYKIASGGGTSTGASIKSPAQSASRMPAAR